MSTELRDSENGWFLKPNNSETILAGGSIFPSLTNTAILNYHLIIIGVDSLSIAQLDIHFSSIDTSQCLSTIFHTMINTVFHTVNMVQRTIRRSAKLLWKKSRA